MEGMSHPNFSKKSLCVGGVNLSLRGRDRSEVVDTGKKNCEEFISDSDGVRGGTKMKLSKSIQQKRPLSFCVENEIIRKFLEKNGVNGFGKSDAEKSTPTYESSDENNGSCDLKPDFRLPDSESKRTADFLSRNRKPTLNKQSTTPRLRSPKSGESTRRDLHRRTTLSEIIDFNIKDATSINVDPEAELSVEHKHYDRWARTKRTAVFSRNLNPDPRYLKMKLSNDAFCFSTLEVQEKETRQDSPPLSFYDKQSSRKSSISLARKNSYDKWTTDKLCEDVYENNQRVNPRIQLDDEPDHDDNSDARRFSDLLEAPSAQDGNRIISDTALNRKWSLGSRRRSSFLLHSEILQSLRDSCSLVITLAQQGDRKLSLSRRVSRSDNIFEKDVDILDTCSQENSEKSSVTSEMSTDRQGCTETVREHESGDEDDEENSDFENILQENCDQQREYKSTAVMNSITKEPVDNTSRDFSFDTDSSSTRETPNTARSKFGREKVQNFKIPLSISKRSPIFSQDDNISIDFQSKRIEEHLSRVQHRNDTTLKVLKRNNCMSNETEDKQPHSSEIKFKIALPKQQKADPKCYTHPKDLYSRWRLRDNAKWRQRVQTLCKGKSYRVSLKSNGIIVKNKYGEFIDHVNLRFLAPLLMKERKSDLL